MTIEIRILSAQPASLQAEAADLLREIGGTEPEAREEESAATGKKDAAMAIAVASLIISIPGAVLAAMDLAERVKLRDKVKALKKRLAVSDADVFLEIEGQAPVDLKSAAADVVVDLLLKARGG